MKKHKKKKEKKVLGIPTNLDFGKKIKNIEINTKKLRISSLVWLVILNIALVGTMIYYLSIAYNPWLLVIAIFTVVICAVWSVLTYRLSVVKIKYAIHQNVIVKDYDSSKTIGEFSKLNGIKIKQTLLDRIGKENTNTIVLQFSNKWCSKISLNCIKENVNELTQLFTTLAKQARENTTIEKVVEKSLISVMLKNSPSQSKLTTNNKKNKSGK